MYKRCIIIIAFAVIALGLRADGRCGEVEESPSLPGIREFESTGHPWVMTLDGGKVTLFSSGYSMSPSDRLELLGLELGDPATRERRILTILRKLREKKLAGKDLRDLREKIIGKNETEKPPKILVKADINATVEEWDTMPEKLEWSGLFYIMSLVPHMPKISIVASSDGTSCAVEYHGGGGRLLELIDVKRDKAPARRPMIWDVKMNVPEEYRAKIEMKLPEERRREGPYSYCDPAGPDLFLFGGELWVSGTADVSLMFNTGWERCVWVGPAKGAKREMDVNYVCPGVQSKIAVTEEGVFCVAKTPEKGRNPEEIGMLSVYFSKDCKEWKHLEGKMPEIRCADYDLTASPDGTIYLFACMVQDKPADEKGDVQVEKTPVLYRTTNIEEGWERIDLSEFEKVDVNSNFQVCFHKGRTVIAAETKNSKIAISALSEEIVKETDEGTNE